MKPSETCLTIPTASSAGSMSWTVAANLGFNPYLTTITSLSF